uniref:Uncharacterized protein n=1 Tax=Panagrolaimus superbus TaxID=310955 RepID=A0A914YPE0_9BILA
MQTSESPNFYGVPFFETSESIRTISSLIGINFDATNKTGEYRIFGLRSSSNIKIDICAPTAKCLNQSGTIELCYFFQNASEDMVHSCDPHFCSIVFGYIGINNTHSNITVSTNDKVIPSLHQHVYLDI